MLKGKKSPTTTALPAPTEGICGAIDQRNQAKCTQPAGHVGVHVKGSYMWKDKPAKGTKAKAPSLTDKCSKCDREMGEHDGNKCPPKQPKTCEGRWDRRADGSKLPKPLVTCERKMGHDGPHRAYAPEGNHVSEWMGDGSRGGCHIPKDRYADRSLEELPGDPPDAEIDDCDDPLEDEICSDDERDFARKMRETREAHEAKLAVEEGGVLGEMREKFGHLSTEGIAEGLTPPPAAFLRSPDRILGYRTHPVAATWPMLTESEINALGESIKARGLHDAIILIDVDGEEFILDGRNRGFACERVGAEPHFETYTGPVDLDSLIAFVNDKNDHRRHNTPSIRAMAAAAQGRLPRGNPGKTGRASGKTQAERAAAARVTDRTVRKAEAVQDKGTPKLNEAVWAGKMSVDAAEVVTKLPAAKQDELADEALAKKQGEMRGGRVRSLVKQEQKREVVRKINAGRVGPLPMGPFGLIYGDYPWFYENSDQHEGSRGHMPYPPMKLDEIVAHALEVASRADVNCVIALWVTNLYVTKTDPVLNAYGANAERRTVFTWPKPRAGVGSLGRGQTEHLVVTLIGSPIHTLNEVSTLLPSWEPEHPGEHSSKPAEVRALLAKHCSGPFLELFSREEHEGWSSWGAETDKFATEAA
jgi:N6-adenosine-specific RNA methylase IME4